MVSIDIRLKLRHWAKKYKGIAFIVLIVWSVIFIVNRYLIAYTPEPVPNTTYTPSVSVISPSSSVNTKTQNEFETLIDKYVEVCNDGNYQKAFNMLSEGCRKYEFNDSVEEFAKHVLTKMPTPKKHSIQNYSKYDEYYIYEVKYLDDILATGLTNSEYEFTTEKIVFYKNSKGEYDMATGNFIKYDKIANVAENDYVKIDVQDRITRYSLETYNVKFTNRTDNTIVIADTLDTNEINLVLPAEYRACEDVEKRIVLGPGQSMLAELSFTKFADDGDESQSILFNSVRVMEKYSGADVSKEEQKKEIDNAIAKFSMQVPVK